MSRLTAGAKAKAYAPASVANVAVGFDIMGFSADIAGDTVTVEVKDASGKRVARSQPSEFRVAGP